jgi:hypothetical protein
MRHDEYSESRAYRWLKSIITPSIGKSILEEKKHFESEGLLNPSKRSLSRLPKKIML